MPGKFIFDPRYEEALLHRRGGRERLREWWAGIRVGWSGYRVLGRRLRPFSLWHKFQLEQASSPFLTSDQMDVVDLELAVRICGTTFPFRPCLPRRGRWRNLLWQLRVGRMDPLRQAQEFETYLNDYYSLPKLWNLPSKRGSNGGKRDVDESLETVALYREYTNCARCEPWDLPYGEIAWMNLVFARRAGSEVKVKTPQDEAAHSEFKKKRDAAHRAQAEAVAVERGISVEEALTAIQKDYWDKVNAKKRAHGLN